ncbi:MAG TPA: hypothetical protein VGK59_01655 [Ohtaekwangia sp.]
MTWVDYLLWYGSIFSPLLPLGFSWKKLLPYQLIIVLFVSASFITDISTHYWIPGRNYWALHVYGFIEAALLLYFYSRVLNRIKIWIYVVTIFYLAFYLINSFLWERNEFNTYARTVEAVIMIILAILLFYKFYQDEEDIFIDRSPLFWMNIAILTYFSGAFFSFILSHEILLGTMMSWRLHNLSNILKNILLAIALWKVPRG